VSLASVRRALAVIDAALQSVKEKRSVDVDIAALSPASAAAPPASAVVPAPASPAAAPAPAAPASPSPASPKK
jgi:hypothetical protein